MKLQHSIFLAFTFLLSICFACNNNSIYHFENRINNDKWLYEKALTFNWNVQDTASWYNMNLRVKHLPELSYRNLYVKCTTHFPDSTIKQQILSLELFDETGMPFGKCSSSECNTDISLISKTKFQFQGAYTLSIEQYGRDSVVQGIHSFTLDVRRIEGSR